MRFVTELNKKKYMGSLGKQKKMNCGKVKIIYSTLYYTENYRSK